MTNKLIFLYRNRNKNSKQLDNSILSFAIELLNTTINLRSFRETNLSEALTLNLSDFILSGTWVVTVLAEVVINYLFPVTFAS